MPSPDLCPLPPCLTSRGRPKGKRLGALPGGGSGIASPGAFTSTVGSDVHFQIGSQCYISVLRSRLSLTQGRFCVDLRADCEL